MTQKIKDNWQQLAAIMLTFAIGLVVAVYTLSNDIHSENAAIRKEHNDDVVNIYERIDRKLNTISDDRDKFMETVNKNHSQVILMFNGLDNRLIRVEEQVKHLEDK